MLCINGYRLFLQNRKRAWGGRDRDGGFGRDSRQWLGAAALKHGEGDNDDDEENVEHPEI